MNVCIPVEAYRDTVGTTWAMTAAGGHSSLSLSLIPFNSFPSRPWAFPLSSNRRCLARIQRSELANGRLAVVHIVTHAKRLTSGSSSCGQVPGTPCSLSVKPSNPCCATYHAFGQERMGERNRMMVMRETGVSALVKTNVRVTIECNHQR